MQPEPKPRAPAVAAKLETARAARAALDADLGEAALAASEGLRGADRRLADLRAQITTADRDVAELERALALALKKDHQAELGARAKIRESQLAAFTGHARARDVSVAEICDALQKLAGSYGRYINLTAKMIGAVPIGTALPVMGVGPNSMFGSAFGNLAGLLAGEAFRHVDVTSQIRAALPFAKAPTIGLSDDPRGVPSGAEAFREATAAVLKEISEQVSKLDTDEALALGAKEAA
jgi:hypothetical protein